MWWPSMVFLKHGATVKGSSSVWQNRIVGYSNRTKDVVTDRRFIIRAKIDHRTRFDVRNDKIIVSNALCLDQRFSPCSAVEERAALAGGSSSQQPTERQPSSPPNGSSRQQLPEAARSTAEHGVGCNNIHSEYCTLLGSSLSGPGLLQITTTRPVGTPFFARRGGQDQNHGHHLCPL